MRNRKPRIRFKSFKNGEWLIKKLSEITNIQDGDRGMNYPSSNDFIENGHTLFLSANNVTKKGFSFEKNQYITNEKSNKMGNGKIELNDLILTTRGSIGHIALYSQEIKERYPFARINSGMLIIRPNNVISSPFIMSYLSSPLGKKQIKRISFGSAQPQLTKKDISNYEIALPIELEEQQKIGGFFKQLDDRIALQQRHVEQLKQSKQGFLQKMFPKDGELVPEVRFEGFHVEWKRKRLDIVSNITMGHSPKGENYTSNSNDYILVQGNADIKNGRVEPRVWTTQVTKKAFPGDIIISVRAPVGEVGKTDFEIVIGRGVASIRGNEFIHQSLKKLKTDNYWRKYCSGSTFESINSNDLKSAVISTPSEEEQQKIGEFFKQLDDLIAKNERELELLQETKKGFLQKMFV